ncbi:hypothetical protein D4764_03G0006080 [Takifugu flavidus]|uniref:Uncharacterized protein n=1 Tax=Takifugu flavidus TaxID=433684 RepID=A0A5C6NCH8_9TELE|nr:hypothetical protein D4764_03G0006080 [Takifugu flavidus]
MSERIYDGRRRCGDGKQTAVAERGQDGIDGGAVTSSLDPGSGGREVGGPAGSDWGVSIVQASSSGSVAAERVDGIELRLALTPAGPGTRRRRGNAVGRSFPSRRHRAANQTSRPGRPPKRCSGAGIQESPRLLHPGLPGLLSPNLLSHTGNFLLHVLFLLFC